MGRIKLTQTCNITTGKLDANAAEDNGKYPYFTCAPDPLRINTFAFDDDVILLAGNNASGNFHCQRYSGKFNAYQRTYVITAKDGYDIDYVFYNLLINLNNLKRFAQGSQTKFLTMPILDAFEIEDIPLSKQKQISRVLSTIDRKYDIILLDQMMPGLSGEDTLNAMKEENILNGTPVIALTADAIIGAKESYISKGFTDYLSKPVKYDALELILKEYIPKEKQLTKCPDMELPVMLIWGDEPDKLKAEKERLDGIYKCVCATGEKAMTKYLEKHTPAGVMHII